MLIRNLMVLRYSPSGNTLWANICMRQRYQAARLGWALRMVIHQWVSWWNAYKSGLNHIKKAIKEQKKSSVCWPSSGVTMIAWTSWHILWLKAWRRLKHWKVLTSKQTLILIGAMAAWFLKSLFIILLAQAHFDPSSKLFSKVAETNVQWTFW